MNPTTRRPAPLATTGIGSVPHTQLEMALQHALSLDIPYLPELPRRASTECFAAQALQGLPGLQVAADGSVSLDMAAWEKGSFALGARLDVTDDTGLLDGFLPTAESCAAWSPFLWEVESRKLAFVKMQCAGPATVLAALGRAGPLPEPVERGVLQFVVNRAASMARAVRSVLAVPMVFLDEPMIGAVRQTSPKAQARELDQLRATVLNLRNEGAITGLHCCGEADWAPLLQLGLDVLSFDATISLDKLLVMRPDVERFLQTGGWLGLGVVPTDARDAAEMERRLEATLAKIAALPLPLRSRILSQSLLTPACGLGARSVRDAEQVFEALGRAQARLRELSKS
jgi:hypothetical protein